jgi:hypothetical protein
MPRVRAALLSVIGSPLIAALLTTAPAGAAERATVPPDVAHAYAGAAAWVHAAFEGDPVLEDATGVRDIVEVFTFTSAYLHGQAGTAVKPSGEWIATIVDARSNAIGELRVWRPDGGEAEIAGGSASHAGDLAAIGSGVYIEEPMTGSAYVLRGDRLSPFNDAARNLLPVPTTLTAFQSVISAWVAESVDAANDIGPDYNLWFFGGALALSTAVGVMVIVQRRRLDRLRQGPNEVAKGLG